MKIIQIAEYDGMLMGLAEDGQLYSLVNKNLGFGLHKPTWELYCAEYGTALTKTVLNQVVDFITGQCYTSTNMLDKLKDYYGSGATVKAMSDTRIEMVSNDRRVTVLVDIVKVPVEDEGPVRIVSGFEITTINKVGDTQTQVVANKRGGSYVRC